MVDLRQAANYILQELSINGFFHTAKVLVSGLTVFNNYLLSTIPEQHIEHQCIISKEKF